MNQVTSKDLWRRIAQLASKSGRRMAAIAYATSEEAIRFGEGDTLIVDASEHAVACGQTSASLLNHAYKRGAEVYSLPGLHAKVLLLDETAVIGSANLSSSSVNTLVEAAIVTDHPAAVATTRAFIEAVKTRATPIDSKYLRRLSSIKVNRGFLWAISGAAAKPVSIPLAEHRTWLVSVALLDESRYEDERERAESGLDEARRLLTRKSSDANWIRYPSDKTRFVKEAKSGDSVIQMWSESHKDRFPTAVYFHSPILMRRREPNCIRIYVEETANSERTALTWRQFLRLTKQIGLPFKVSPHSVRVVPDSYSDALAALWKKQRKA